MRYLPLSLLLTAILAAGGCGEKGKNLSSPVDKPAEKATSSGYCHVSGTIGKVVACNPSTTYYALVDFDQITLTSTVTTSVKRVIDGNTTITSPFIMTLDVLRDSKPPVKSLLGPGGTSGVASGKPAYIDAPPRFIEVPMPGFYLMNGWLFLNGEQPIAKTNYVAAGADGSEMAVDIRDSYTRIYFLESESPNAKGYYRINSTASWKTVDYPNIYVDINTSVSPPTASDPNPVVPNDPFLVELRGIRNAARY